MSRSRLPRNPSMWVALGFTACFAVAAAVTVFLPGRWGTKGSDALSALAALGAVVCILLGRSEEQR